MSLSVNIGGAWESITGSFVNIGGTWQAVASAYINIGGTWQTLSLALTLAVGTVTIVSGVYRFPLTATASTGTPSSYSWSTTVGEIVDSTSNPCTLQLTSGESATVTCQATINGFLVAASINVSA